MAVWPYLGEGVGPIVSGYVQAITSKSKRYKSLKNYFSFHPPKISILLPAIKFALWPNLLEGLPDPSGP